MTEEHGFMDALKVGLETMSKIVSAAVYPPVVEKAELLVKKVEGMMIRMEKKLIRKMAVMMIMAFGSLFLVFALLYSLIDYFGLSRALAFFSIGITVLVVGLLLIVFEPER
jgi:hypothetical protein